MSSEDANANANANANAEAAYCPGGARFSYPSVSAELKPLLYQLDTKIYGHVRNMADVIDAAREALFRARLSAKHRSQGLGYTLTAAWLSDLMSDWVINRRTIVDFNGGAGDIYANGGTLSYGMADGFSNLLGEALKVLSFLTEGN